MLRTMGTTGGLAETEPKRKLTLREPSKLERDIMAAARARQRANIVKKQVVLGREYKGTGFLPAPAIIDFKDFTVGKTMKLRIVLTNVSLTFNSFKSESPRVTSRSRLRPSFTHSLARHMAHSPPATSLHP